MSNLLYLDRINRRSSDLARSIENVDFQYEYPRKLKLHPKEDQHHFLVNYVLDLAETAQRVTKTVRDEWQKLEWNLSAFVPAKDAEAAIIAKDWRKPVTVVVPMSFASLETFLTYFSSTFIQQRPIHRYRGIGSNKAKVQAALLERVVQRQSLWFKEGLHLNSMFRSAFVYGLGVVSPRWSKHRARAPVREEVTDLLAAVLADTDLGVSKGDILRFFEDQILFEGSKLENWDDYALLLDPNGSLNDIQDSEFIGHVESTNIMDVLRREPDPEERCFNGKYLRMAVEGGVRRSRFNRTKDSGRNTRFGIDQESMDGGKNKNHPVDRVRIYSWIVPSELGLGDEDDPELWKFAVCADAILTECEPLGMNHGMFPIAACGPSTTGHDIVPVSHLATTFGLQKYIDWSFRDDVARRRKSLNGSILWDPTKIEEEDMMSSEPGKRIRLKQSAFGNMNLDSFIKELSAPESTRNHMQEMMLVIDLLRQSNGTTDITMGNLSAMPERPTSSGIEMAKTGALSRLQHIAMVVAMQGMNDIAWQHAYNTIQFMDESVYVPILGRLEDDLRREYGMVEEVQVSPLDLSPNFEVEPHNGAFPENTNVSALTQILQTFLQVEGVVAGIAESHDIGAFFEHWARTVGAEDFLDFRRAGGQLPGQNVQVMPDEQFGQQVQQGNLVSPNG